MARRSSFHRTGCGTPARSDRPSLRPPSAPSSETRVPHASHAPSDPAPPVSASRTGGCERRGGAPPATRARRRRAWHRARSTPVGARTSAARRTPIGPAPRSWPRSGRQSFRYPTSRGSASACRPPVAVRSGARRASSSGFGASSVRSTGVMLRPRRRWSAGAPQAAWPRHCSSTPRPNNRPRARARSPRTAKSRTGHSSYSSLTPCGATGRTMTPAARFRGTSGAP